MRSTIRGRLLLAALAWYSGGTFGDSRMVLNPRPCRRLEMAVLYNSLLSNVVRADRFWMQGGSIQVEGQFWHGLGVEADISGFHAQDANNAGVGLDMVTATFGPRYRWSPAHHRCSFFGHALAGRSQWFQQHLSRARLRPPAARTVLRCRLAEAWTCRSNIVSYYAFSRPTGCARNCPTRTLTSKTVFVWVPEPLSDFNERLENFAH